MLARCHITGIAGAQVCDVLGVPCDLCRILSRTRGPGLHQCFVTLGDFTLHPLHGSVESRLFFLPRLLFAGVAKHPDFGPWHVVAQVLKVFRCLGQRAFKTCVVRGNEPPVRLRGYGTMSVMWRASAWRLTSARAASSGSLLAAVAALRASFSVLGFCFWQAHAACSLPFAWRCALHGVTFSCHPRHSSSRSRCPVQTAHGRCRCRRI